MSKKRIKAASAEVSKLITSFATQGSHFARGMAAEGYNGGYRDALQDVLLLLNKCEPCCRPEFWRLTRNHD